ncbi:MAG: acyltransferase family protein [Nitrospirae bacterium]|nr:acyltransferase family protein [Nitrospirota bacterium]
MTKRTALSAREIDTLLDARLQARSRQFRSKLDETLNRIQKKIDRPPSWAKGGMQSLEELESDLAVLRKFVSSDGQGHIPAPGPQRPASLPRDERPATRTGEPAEPTKTRPDLSLIDRALQSFYRLRMILRSEQVDEYGLDPVFFDFVKPIVEFFYRKYFRVDVKGLEHVPSEGRGLLVGNHSGVLPYDGMMVCAAVMFDHPSGRIPRFLAEDMFSNYPILSPMMTKGGTVRACQENAERLLRNDQLVAVFPEGVKGIGKLYRERYHLQRFGRGGFIRLALRTRAPLIPVAVVGAEESMPMIAKSDLLARIIGIPYFPITPNMLFLTPLLGPTGGLVPFPTKWTIEFGEPILLPSNVLGAPDEDLKVNLYKEDIRDRLQEMINGLVKKRKSVWWG